MYRTNRHQREFAIALVLLATQTGMLNQDACAKDGSALSTNAKGPHTVTSPAIDPRKIRLKTAFDNKEWASSLSIANQILKDQPDDPVILVLKGCSLTGLSRHKESEPFFRRALQLDPNSGNRSHHIAILSILGRIDEASKELDELLALDPNHNYGRALAAKLALQKGQITRGVELFTKLSGEPGNVRDVAIHLNASLAGIDFAKLPPPLVDRLAKNLEPLASKMPEATSILAHVYVDTQRFQKAISLAQLVIQKNPKDRQFLNIANLLAAKQRDEEALLCLPKPGSAAEFDEAIVFRFIVSARLRRYGEALNTVLTANPDLTRKHQLSASVADCARRLSSSADAESNLARMEKIKSTNWLHHFVYATMLEQTGKPDAALAEYRQAYTGAGINTGVAYNYSIFLMEEKKYKEANDVVEKLPHKDEPTLNVQVRALMRLNRGEDAMAAVNKFAPEGKRSASFEMISADVSRQMAKPHEAMEHFNKAVALDPKSLYARQRRMEFARAIRRYDLVCQDLNYALLLSPNNHHLYFQKALYEQLSGKTAEANRDWSQAIFLKPR